MSTIPNTYFRTYHTSIIVMWELDEKCSSLKFQQRWIDIYSQNQRTQSMSGSQSWFSAVVLFLFFCHDFFVFGSFVFCLLLIFDFLCFIVIHSNCFTFISSAYDWVNSLPFCSHQCLAAAAKTIVVSIEGLISSLAFVFRIQTKNLSSWGRGGKE